MSQNTSIPTGSAFFDHNDILEPALLDIIAEIAHCAIAASWSRKVAADPKERAPKRWLLSAQNIVGRSETLSYRLLHEVPINDETSDSLANSVNEVCVIALLMWLSYLPMGTMTTLPIASDAASLRKLVPGRGPRLVQRLSCIDVTGSVSASHLRLLLWTLGIGIVCAVDEDDTEWCAKRFAMLAPKLGITNHREISTFMETYLWFGSTDQVNYLIAGLMNSRTQHEEVKTVQRIIRLKNISVHRTSPMKPGDEKEKKKPTRITNTPGDWYRMGG